MATVNPQYDIRIRIECRDKRDLDDQIEQRVRQFMGTGWYTITNMTVTADPVLTGHWTAEFQLTR